MVPHAHPRWWLASLGLSREFVSEGGWLLQRTDPVVREERGVWDRMWRAAQWSLPLRSVGRRMYSWVVKGLRMRLSFRAQAGVANRAGWRHVALVV